MSRNKELGRKIRLMKRTRENRRVPGWVLMRTDRKVNQNVNRRNWRKNNLKL
ncbi:MAG: 50S ribosomal protein L39e [Candidatus Thermoplasmatota archaeon]|jgi:large subunit ribosomal protein L39e|nr:50S ribosomal protein L39e [Candidatus Thermoplasmatota archaeon]MCL5987358.1 50S ribosomal protein L39e [Candidatus Thermoplasmatota archaeon]